MAITTVGELRDALKGLRRSLPVELVENEGVVGREEDFVDAPLVVRPFQVYRMTKVTVGTVGTGGNPPKTVLVEVMPK